MIGEHTLEILCNKYNISKEKLVDNNNNILSYGEFNEIDRTLDYLINSLKLLPSNIEKCPSILYRNTDNIKDNADFLKKQKISFSSIESCLHVLSTDPNQLIQTYNYVEGRYGIAAIKTNPSILACSIDIIDSVEKLGLKREYNLAIAISISFGYTKLENVQKIINSAEFKDHPELFTSQTLAHAKLEDIQEIINSDEYKNHPELFTSTTLAHAKLEEIQKIVNSDEFKEHPELFTSTTLANAKLEDIQEIINSDEFKEHPELFTSETLAHAKLEDIQEIINSDEFKEHPELFTSTTLANAKLEDIQELLNLSCFQNEKYKRMLTPSIVSKSKSMIKKMPILIEMAEYYKIDDHINTNFLLHSPSQNYALINYLIENDNPLVINEKLNPIFSYQPGVLRKKYGINIKVLMDRYPIPEKNIGGKVR